MKICPKCNSLCEDSASFCQECGAPLPTPNDNAHTQENQKQQESQFQQNAYYPRMHTRTTIIRTIITGTGQLQALCHVILYLQLFFLFSPAASTVSTG